MTGSNARKRACLLQIANSDPETFSYSVSHELRAPLRAIVGHADLLAQQTSSLMSEESRNSLRHIRKAAARMQSLIDDLLRLAEVTSSELQYEYIDLAPLARDTIEQLRSIDPTRTPDIRIPREVPAYGDAQLTRIVLENLISNAWKFTSKRQDAIIEIGMKTGPEMSYFVQDNGVGFDLSRADHLFLPFQRLHSRDEFPGTGVGLAIVRRIIERHGGRIWVESSVGLGTTFRFTLAQRPL